MLIRVLWRMETKYLINILVANKNKKNKKKLHKRMVSRCVSYREHDNSHMLSNDINSLLRSMTNLAQFWDSHTVWDEINCQLSQGTYQYCQPFWHFSHGAWRDQLTAVLNSRITWKIHWKFIYVPLKYLLTALTQHVKNPPDKYHTLRNKLYGH